MAEIAKIKGYDIRDKKLADATSQSTVAATDAIEMKTTSGDQVYITRDSFVQAMASVLNSNIQSTISNLFGINVRGEHAAINMTNLMSILLTSKYFEGSELNDLKSPGVWSIRSYTNNAPSIYTNTCIVFGIATNSATGLFQVCFGRDQNTEYSPKLYLRRYWNGNWSGWSIFEPTTTP